MEAITDTTRPLARGIEQSDFCSSVKYLSLVRVERGGSELGVWRITRRPLCPLPIPHGRAREAPESDQYPRTTGA